MISPYFGGNANNGSNAGLGYRNANNGRGNANINIGFRPSRSSSGAAYPW